MTAPPVGRCAALVLPGNSGAIRIDRFRRPEPALSPNRAIQEISPRAIAAIPASATSGTP